jgi:hypothetical protein
VNDTDANPAVFYQHVSADAAIEENLSGFSQQLDKNMEEAELLRSSGRTRMLTGGRFSSRFGGRPYP